LSTAGCPPPVVDRRLPTAGGLSGEGGSTQRPGDTSSAGVIAATESFGAVLLSDAALRLRRSLDACRGRSTRARGRRRGGGSMVRILGSLSALCAVLAGCTSNGAAPGGEGAGLGAGDHEISVRHGGRNRAYLVHVPPSRGVLPVVLAFHGGGGEARGFQEYAGLDGIADREGFVVVYPYGSGVLPRRLLTWNAGACCGRAMSDGVDDVAFAIAVLDDLGRRLPIDAHRVYATGHSNGAMMAHRLAAERGDRIAAIAPVAGALNLETLPTGPPVAVLHIHSVDDPRALYEGGLGPPFPGTDARSLHRPVEEGLGRWRTRNGCAERAREVETRAGEVGSGNEGQTATLLVWEPCAAGVTVAHWKLTGVGHGWPGNEDSGLREELIGPATTLVDAAEEAWRFFEGRTR
jgi:polyhydroxybutyrate depolymerase